ncbi:MAG: glycosyltransferase [Planctomycetota bacterium]|nr:glycosyltransferase [Planctomycetota bacterium]
MSTIGRSRFSQARRSFSLDDPMRIAWFTHRYYPVVSGAENFGREMVRRFVADGHDVDVITSDADNLGYFTNPAIGPVSAPEVSTVDGARVRRLAVKHRFGQKYAGRLLSFLPHWPTQCRYESFMPIIPGIDRIRGDFDAVFAVGFPYTIFSYAARQTARAADSPLILTPFLHLATPGDPVNRSYTRPHQSRLLREADAVVVQTRLEADAIADRGVDRAKTLILGMGVDQADVVNGDTRRFREQFAIPQARRVIGHLATLDPNKGTTDLVLAVNALNAERMEDPIHLLLAGPTSVAFDAFASTIPKDCERWISRTGPLPMDRRADFFAAIDVFAMPSRTDSFGIVFLEAWANGLPVVGASAGGVAEVIKDRHDGLLVPFGDVGRLAMALERLVTDPSLARSFGRNGKAKIARGYSWDDRYRTLLERTQALIARSGPRVDLGHGQITLARPLTGVEDSSIV